MKKLLTSVIFFLLIMCCSNTQAQCTVTISYTIGQNGTVFFTANTAGAGSPTLYTWALPTNYTAGVNTCSITYPNNGTYNVSVSVNFTPACTATAIAAITITNATGNCTLAANFNYTEGSLGQVYFQNTTNDTSASVTYLWKFGDNSTSTLTTPPVHTYSNNGNYQATLTAIKGPSCTNSSLKTVSVTSYCTLNNVAFGHTVGASGSVTFANQSQGTASNTTYYWNFGDGVYSTHANPVHQYNSPGAKTVLLQVTNGLSCVKFTNMVLNVTGLPCSANAAFSFSAMPGNPIYWNAVPVNPWSVSDALWDWGDGTSSPTLYATHQYSVGGSYKICLTVTVACGATASTCGTYTVYKSNGTQTEIDVNVINPQLISGFDEESVAAFDFNLFPNPSSGEFVLNIMSLPDKVLNLTIVDLYGKTVYNEEIECNGTGITRNIAPPNIQQGLYFINLRSGNNSATKKLIINKY